MNQLRVLGVRVIFEQEVLGTADTDNDLIISIIESIAQAENESRSDNINDRALILPHWMWIVFFSFISSSQRRM